MLGIVNSPGYSPPPAPQLPVRNGYVQPWGAAIAAERRYGPMSHSGTLTRTATAVHAQPRDWRLITLVTAIFAASMTGLYLL